MHSKMRLEASRWAEKASGTSSPNDGVYASRWAVEACAPTAATSSAPTSKPTEIKGVSLPPSMEAEFEYRLGSLEDRISRLEDRLGSLDLQCEKSETTIRAEPV